uniref:Amino acid transporter transmembrane domain-containing protein n=1 Tax=Alexandrium catenella TaxID=2925 RepID=A0A7S1WAZ8_ALECA
MGEAVATTRQGVSFNDAVITIVINATGCAIVLFPKIMADVGIVVAPILCATCALTCLECGIMICGACTIAEKSLGAERINTYEALAEAISGTRGKRFLTVTKNSVFMGTLIAYIQLSVDSMASFIPGGSEDSRVLFLLRYAVILPIFSFLAMLTDLQQLAKFSTVGIIAVIVECGCIMVGGVYLGMYTPCDAEVGGCIKYDVLPDKPLGEMPGVFGKYLAVFLFSYAILATVPVLRSQLAEPEQMHPILSRAFLILGFLYCTVMGLGYMGFGSDAPDNVIQGLAVHFPVVGLLASGAILINIVISAPLTIFCIVTAFEASGESAVHTPLSMPNVLFRIGLIILACVIGAILPYITEIIGVVASLFACCNNILFPMTFHYVGRQQASVQPLNPAWRRVKYFSALTVGLIVLVFGFSGSVMALMAKLQEDSKLNDVVTA